MVKHYLPSSFQEALEIKHQEDVMLIAGGTDLMVQHRTWSELPPQFDKPLLFLFNLAELKYIKKDANTLYIGSMTDLETLLYHNDTPPCLKDIIALMASPAIRYVCTLAGNIVNASPAADSLLALYALDAKLVLTSLKEERIVSIESFITGPRQTIIKSNEIIKEIQLPHQPFNRVHFKKIGGRKSDAISKLAFLGLANVNQDHQIDTFRIVLNAVAPTLIRLHETERTVEGLSLEAFKHQKDALLEAYNTAIKPIDDQRSNRTYRRQAALNLIRQFIETL